MSLNPPLIKPDSRLERDFLKASGAAFLEWASRSVAYYKILNDMAFAQFQNGGSKDFRGLLTSCGPDSLATASLGDRLVGEFFSRVRLGRNVSVGNDVNMVAHGGITCHDNVRIGDNVQLITVFHSIHPDQRMPIRTCPIIIEEGAVIESGALIISSRRSGNPVVIGKNARVLANSVVVSNVADNAIVSGKPAQPVSSAEAIGNSFATAQRGDLPMNISTIEQVRAALGHQADVCLPVSILGSEHISNQGFYLLNRRCQLDLQGPLHIGEDVLMAPAVSITVEPGASLTIGKNVWIGAGATLSAQSGQHLSIGEGAIVGAGAEITQNVPPRSVMLERNVLKRPIQDEDYDVSIPAAWTDTDSIHALRHQNGGESVQREIELLLASGHDMKVLLAKAEADIHAVAHAVAATPVRQEEPSFFANLSIQPASFAFPK
jgi:acetyltransferase-like isoleucine patch superfamily enzyme